MSKPNVDGIHDFERDFRAFETRLIQSDIPHEQQVRATAMFLAQSFEIPVLELMRDQGFDAFAVKVRHGQFDAPPGSARTPFTTDDLRFIYDYCLQTLQARLARQNLRGGEPRVQ